MTKQEKIEKLELKLQNYIDNKSYIKICRTVFDRDENISGFILRMSNDFVFVQDTYDFMFNGYAIIKKDSIDKIRHSGFERTMRKIYKAEGLLTEGYGFDKYLPLTNWKDLLTTLKEYDYHVVIENFNEDYLDFWIGEIVNVTDESIAIHNYDPNGILDEEPKSISFDSISSLKFLDSYSTTFRKYLKRRKKKATTP